MDSIETGGLIASLRKEAGYTQKQLADALFVSDKAVSKWERGICLPDSALLPKLSMLLDADIEYIILGSKPYRNELWSGKLIINDLDKSSICGKPVIHYLLSYFMLAGISDISIQTNDWDYIESLNLSQYGLNISKSNFGTKNVMMIYDSFFLFGVSLTRQFNYCMSKNKNIILFLGGEEIPIVFSKNARLNIDWHKENSEKKFLGRGMIYLPLKTNEQINDASELIEVYEKYSKMKISDLGEIARLRELVK